MAGYFFEIMPIPGVYVLVVVLILLACEAGFVIGRAYHRRHRDDAAPGAMGPVVGGLLGMLAFLLAFTFSMAATQHGTRKQNVLQEANLIGTAYLRADLLPPASRDKVRTLLRDYVDLRLEAARTRVWQPANVRSRDIHAALWQVAAAAAMADPGTNTSLAVQSVNEVIVMHETRVIGAVHSRISGTVWIGLLAIAALTMGTLGLQVGLNGKRRLIAVMPLALTFAVLVTLIVDLNRPQGGFMTVSQQALQDLQAEMVRARE